MNEVGIISYNSSSLTDAAYSAIQLFHKVPRFGFPNDAALLASRSSMDQEAYLKGAVLPAVFFLSIFLSWVLFLLVCYFLGRKRVGFLSGSPFVVADERRNSRLSLRVTTTTVSEGAATDSSFTIKAVSNGSPGAATNLWSGVIGTLENAQPNDMQQKYRRRGMYFKSFIRQSLSTMSLYFKTCVKYFDRPSRPRAIRIIFLVSGLLLCGSLITLIVVGTKEIKATSASLKDSGMLIKNRIVEGADIMAQLSTNFNSALKIKETLYPLMNQYCKNEKKDISEVLNFDKNTIQDNFSMLDHYMNSDTQRNIPDLFFFAQREQQNMENIMNHINMALSLGIAYVVSFFMSTVFLMIGVWRILYNKSSPNSNRYIRFLNFFAAPLFVICILCSYLSASSILLSGILNADACYELNIGSQDAFVATVLDSARVDRKSFAYYAITKVAGDCTGRIVNLQEKKEKVISAMKQTQGVLQTIEERKVNELNAACSITEFDAIRQMVTDFSKNLETILNSLQRTESLLSCETLTPIYKKVTSESLCTYSVVFFAWTFSCLTIASFFGTMMITFRSSWKLDSIEPNNSNGSCIEENANVSNAHPKISTERDSEVWSTRMSDIQNTDQPALESYKPQVGTSSLEDIATNLTAWDWDWNKPSMKTKEIV